MSRKDILPSLSVIWDDVVDTLAWLEQYNCDFLSMLDLDLAVVFLLKTSEIGFPLGFLVLHFYS